MANKKIRLKDWCELEGISYKTALDQFNDGTIDAETYESKTNRKFILVDANDEIINKLNSAIKILKGVVQKLK